jgi:hypothetical protein
MIIKNKIEKPFGPGGSSMGFFLFIAGVIITYFSFIGLIFAFIGAFMGFTTMSTIIDIDNRRVKNVHYIFGIIPIGKWIEIVSGMQLGLKKIHRGYRTSTRGNSLDIHINDVRIMLYSFDNKIIMPLKKLDSIDKAKEELEQLSNQLELVVI